MYQAVIEFSQGLPGSLEKYFLREWQAIFHETFVGAQHYKQISEKILEYAQFSKPLDFSISKVLFNYYKEKKALKNTLHQDCVSTMVILQSLLIAENVSAVNVSEEFNCLVIQEILNNFQLYLQQENLQIIKKAIFILASSSEDINFKSLPKNFFRWISNLLKADDVELVRDSSCVLTNIFKHQRNSQENEASNYDLYHQSRRFYSVEDYSDAGTSSHSEDSIANQGIDEYQCEFTASKCGMALLDGLKRATEEQSKNAILISLESLSSEPAFYLNTDLEGFIAELIAVANKYSREPARIALRILCFLTWQKIPWEERVGSYQQEKSLIRLFCQKNNMARNLSLNLICQSEFFKEKKIWSDFDRIFLSNVVTVAIYSKYNEIPIEAVLTVLSDMIESFSWAAPILVCKLKEMHLTSYGDKNKDFLIKLIGLLVNLGKNNPPFIDHVIDKDFLKIVFSFLAEEDSRFNLQALNSLKELVSVSNNVIEKIDCSLLLANLLKCSQERQSVIYLNAKALLVDLIELENISKINQKITIFNYHKWAVGFLIEQLVSYVSFSLSYVSLNNIESQVVRFLFSIIYSSVNANYADSELAFLAIKFLAKLSALSGYQAEIFYYENSVNILLDFHKQKNNIYADYVAYVLSKLSNSKKIPKKIFIFELLKSGLSAEIKKLLNIPLIDWFSRLSELVSEESFHYGDTSEFVSPDEINAALLSKNNDKLISVVLNFILVCAKSKAPIFNYLFLSLVILENIALCLTKPVEKNRETAANVIIALINRGHEFKQPLLQAGVVRQLLRAYQHYRKKIFIVALSELKYISVVDISDYHQGQLLGAGSFGSVSIFQNKITQEQFAVKKFIVETVSDLSDFADEIDVLKKLQPHQHIVEFEAVMVNERRPLLLVMKLYPEGKLSDLLANYKKIIDGRMKYRFMLQTCLAIQYMHLLGYIHRDIKPDNILLSDDMQIKLIDFGLAIKEVEVKSPGGTTKYMASEILCDKKLNSMATDIWALGITMWEIFTRRIFFQNMNRSLIVNCIENACENRSALIMRAGQKNGEIHADIFAPCTMFQPASRSSVNQVIEKINSLMESQQSHDLAVIDSRQTLSTAPAIIDAPVVVTSSRSCCVIS